MLLHLLKKANMLQWELVLSLDTSAKYVHQKNGPDYPLDVHSWFFRKKNDLQAQGNDAVANAFGETFQFAQEWPSAPPFPSAPPVSSLDLPPPSYEDVMNEK